jgi:hypothetical protein
MAVTDVRSRFGVRSLNVITQGCRVASGLPSVRRSVAIASVAMLSTLAAACGSDNEPGSAGADDDIELAHVHGLGINPADDALIVATHDGAFRIAAGGDEAEPIGDRQDTMGFTVVGPDHFLGSGHPDQAGLEAGQPPRLGLIESTDGGASWTAISLGGEVDFHALAAAHDQVYGWDSGTGRFMVSTDGSDWDVRSTIGIFGFAVDPADAGHIVAAGPDGLLDSTDGGTIWSAIDGPPLVIVSWDETTGLWGVAPDGAVHHQESSGWGLAGGLPGQPQALLATTDALYAAAFDSEGRTGIYRSTDGGDTWELHFRDD